MLQRYLTTRRGNCITMPILFLALGQRLGLTMTLAEAPLHVFVKYTDDGGVVWNLEPTSGGGFTRDAWYRKKLPMSDKAVANGVYLRPLAHEEATALIDSEIERLTPDAISAGLNENLARRKEHTREIYLHIDLDSLDPSEGRANGFAVDGGLASGGCAISGGRVLRP